MDSPNGQNGTGSSENITRLLARWRDGDENAFHELTRLVYPFLRRLAASYIRKERREHTLETTALVSELYLKIPAQQRTKWHNRGHFFGVAAKLMRHILVDRARKHYASRNNSGRNCVSLENVAAFGAEPDESLMALHEVLNRLEEFDPDLARIVDLRFFVGHTIEETAEVLEISHSTVEREWDTAKAFLYRELTRRCK